MAVMAESIHLLRQKLLALTIISAFGQYRSGVLGSYGRKHPFIKSQKLLALTIISAFGQYISYVSWQLWLKVSIYYAK